MGAIGNGSSVTLREVTKENLREVLRLKVGAAQERFVAPNAVSIAQAYFDRDIAWFRAIYADETPVGFLMIEDHPAKGEYHLWRFMVDERHQGRGFGARAIGLLADHVRARPKARHLTTSCVPGEGSPGPFYERQGFSYTGEQDGIELVMSRPL
jgi:diamine N-acetyltransferase